MPQMIRDGKGRSYLVAVNKNNQMQISSVGVTQEHYVNHIFQEAYNILWTITDTTGSDQIILHIDNLGAKNIIFEGINFQASANVILYMKFAMIGTPGGGTDAEVINLNSGSGNILNVAATEGNGLTGLTGGRIFWRTKIAGSEQSDFMNFDADIILTPHQTMTLLATSTEGFDNMGFFVCYVDPDGGI